MLIVLGYVLIIVSMLGLYAARRGCLGALAGKLPESPAHRRIAGWPGDDARPGGGGAR